MHIFVTPSQFGNIVYIFCKTERRTTSENDDVLETGEPLLENSPQNGKQV